MLEPNARGPIKLAYKFGQAVGCHFVGRERETRGRVNDFGGGAIGITIFTETNKSAGRTSNDIRSC